MSEKQRSFGKWQGQNIIAPGISVLFGKRYVWLQDGDNTIYLLKVDENNVPQLL